MKSAVDRSLQHAESGRTITFLTSSGAVCMSIDPWRRAQHINLYRDATKAALIFLSTVGVLFTIYLLARRNSLPVGNLTRDMAAVAGVHPLVGLLSNLGVLFWSATTAVCIFTSALLFRKADKSESYFFLSSGLLTFALLNDDFFLVHEDLAQRYVGVGEKVVYLSYLVVMTSYIAVYWERILFNEPLLFILALTGFSVSLASDVFLEPLLDSLPWYYLLEDGSKFLGIANWFAYFVTRCHLALAKNMS